MKPLSMQGRRTWRAAALATLGSVAAAACAPSGEIMLAVQTDMAPPADFDTIQIEAYSGSALKFSNYYRKIGQDDAEAKLPITLGFLADPSEEIRIQVSARVGGDLGAIRVQREAVTKVPEERVVVLQLPMHFLCDGKVGDSACAEGETCIAGECAPREVDSSKLPDYAPEDVYGGGSGFGDGACLDVAACFAGASVVTELDAGACSFPGAEDINVALRTTEDGAAQGDGICNDDGCFVALDAESDAGWRAAGGQVQLPRAVCDQISSGKISAIVTAPRTESCPPKTVGLPTCGPWSATAAP